MTKAPLPLDWTRLQKHDCNDILCTGCLPTTTPNDGAARLRPNTGSAMLCLPDAENDWFQGYFISNTNETFKLLCIQQDNADPCLQCDDYQLWTVTLYHPTTTTSKTKKQDFGNVISRGGDCICWHHERIQFRAGVVHTGNKSYQLVKRYFGSLLKNLCDDESETVETIMPNVAIVTGEMTIWL